MWCKSFQLFVDQASTYVNKISPSDPKQKLDFSSVYFQQVMFITGAIFEIMKTSFKQWHIKKCPRLQLWPSNFELYSKCYIYDSVFITCHVIDIATNRQHHYIFLLFWMFSDVIRKTWKVWKRTERMALVWNFPNDLLSLLSVLFFRMS